MVRLASGSRSGGGPRNSSAHRPVGAVRLETVPCASVRSTDRLTAARAEALFTSDLSARSPLTEKEVTDAIRRAVRKYGGTRGCASEVAAAYGEHPETAGPRMRWARTLVESVYAEPALAP